MLIKQSTARTLPVILIDSSDFITPITGTVFGDVTCKFRKEGDTSWTTKTIDATNWTEIDDGHYDIDFTAGNLDTNGLFIYIVTVSGALQYSGLFIIRTNTNDDIKADTAATLVDTNEIQGKLPTNEIMGSSDKADNDTVIDAILADTAEIQGKLPTNNIMGSSTKDNKDDEIDSIKSTVEAIDVENFNGSEDTT